MGSDVTKRVLRIGIIQGGKIVEERLIRKRETITIGQGPRNTFIIPIPQLPRSYTLFDLSQGRYHLAFDETMDGRVSVGGTIVDLAAAARAGTVRQRGGLYILDLTDESRGKVVLGDVTLLFQFVDAPPVMPKPQLPAAARGARMDWTFAYLLMLSFIFQGGAGIGLDIWWRVEGQYLQDPLQSQSNKRYQLLKSMAKTAKEEEKKEEKKEEEKKEEDDQAKTDEAVVEEVVEKKKPRVRAKLTPKKRSSGKSDMKSLNREVRNKTVMSALTALGADGPGIAGMSDDDFKRSANTAFKGGVVVDDGQMATGPSGVVGPDGPTKKGEDIKNIRRRTGPLTKTTVVKRSNMGNELKIKVRSGSASGQGGLGEIDAREVSKRIRRRSSAVKACYERALRASPNLKGKLALRFKITGSGRVDPSVRIKSNQTNSAVANCIIGKLRSWRFPKPKKGTVSFNYTWVFSGR